CARAPTTRSTIRRTAIPANAWTKTAGRSRSRSGPDQVPSRVVAVRVAGAVVVVEEVERQPVVGHLDRSVAAGDGGQRSRDTGDEAACEPAVPPQAASDPPISINPMPARPGSVISTSP